MISPPVTTGAAPDATPVLAGKARVKVLGAKGRSAQAVKLANTLKQAGTKVTTIANIPEARHSAMKSAGIMLRHGPVPCPRAAGAPRRPGDPLLGELGCGPRPRDLRRRVRTFLHAAPGHRRRLAERDRWTRHVVEKALEDRGVPFLRTRPVPLEELPGVLLAADVHLITLDDRFVGYVLPSKVYACVASGKPVLFIGSVESDVHLVARERPGDAYRQVNVGDPDGVADALEALLGVSR